ncbi:MAG: MFS transporter [Nevskia sp.]|nr:MFS transporter [Nevskia sp.]
MTPQAPRAAHPPPWLFGITNIPFGVSGGYTSVAMPFILRQADVSVATIGAISAAVLLPLSYQFLWAPLLDFGLPRRAWLILAAALGSLLLSLSLFLRLPSQLLPFEICCVVGQGLTGLVSSCNGALIATQVPGALHGRAAGWLNAANLGGNAVGGGLVLGMAHLYGNQAAAVGMGLVTFLPALAAVAVTEQRRETHRLAVFVPNMLRDLWNTARSRAGWTGILFCLAPVSTPALLDLFSAVAEDYHASGRTVEFTMGYGSGLATVAGALLAGRFLDRVNRRSAYLLSGALLAIVDVAMERAPLTPFAYVAGTMTYSLAAGVCFAAFTAMVFEIIAGANHSAASQYTLFDAAGWQVTSFLAWADGLGYGYFKDRHLSGPSGLLLMDALMNVAGICFLGALMAVLKARRPRPAVA